MKPKVYIETTIISYLTAWRSPQLVMAANQEMTRDWWDDERDNFDLYRNRDCQWNGLPADVELSPHCKCDIAVFNERDLPGSRVRDADHLYAPRIDSGDTK